MPFANVSCLCEKYLNIPSEEDEINVPITLSVFRDKHTLCQRVKKTLTHSPANVSGSVRPTAVGPDEQEFRGGAKQADEVRPLELLGQ